MSDPNAMQRTMAGNPGGSRTGAMSFPFFNASRPALIAPGARVCTVVVDAEESFDWNTPVRGTAYTTSCMRNLGELHGIVGAYGAVPAYLLTYPVLEDADVVRSLRHQADKGRCALGVQLHPWVTPPFGDDVGARYSFSGNLRSDLEERKLVALKAKFVERFGCEPLVYRSGRYGVSRETAGLLEKHGFAIDTSLAPRTTFDAEGGPDTTTLDYGLFWFGKERNLLEVPLCRSVVGWAGSAAGGLYCSLGSPWATHSPVSAMLSRSRCAERITLSPEGNDFPAMRRLVHGLCARGQTILALSFHSSSLEVGGNPYVMDRADLHAFYDRLSATLDHLASDLRFSFADILRVPDYLLDAPSLASPCLDTAGRHP